MSKSTASFIAYDLRPAKQIERRMLVDFVRSASASGIDLSTYHYIGMGGIRFIDFLMINRYLGIIEMTSMEQSQELYPRCEFNNPLGSIKLFQGESSTYLSGYDPASPALVWLDYDWTLGGEVREDILTLGNKVKPGSFVFATVSGDPPRFLREKSVEARLAHYLEELGSFAVGLDKGDFQNAQFKYTVSEMLLSIFIYAFSTRTDGVFLPMFKVIYKDTMPMITVGGCFVSDECEAPIRAALENGIPALACLQEREFYEIETLNLTEAERMLFERVATSDGGADGLMSLLLHLGFEDADVTAYRNVVRFAPRYVEAYL